MAISLNKVMLVGRLGKDPERRGGSDGPVTFSVATSETWKDKRSGDRKERTQWTNVVVWNEQAQKFLTDYVRKGDLIYVEGQIETRDYEKDGEKKYVTEVVVRPFSGSVQSMGKDRQSGSSDREERDNDFGQERSSGRDSDRGYSGGGSGGFSRDLDDDIPFAPEWR